MLTFFIVGRLYLLRFERVDNLGAYRIPPETGILIPSDNDSYSRARSPRDAKEKPPRRWAACILQFRTAQSVTSSPGTPTLLLSVFLFVFTSTVPVVAPDGTLVSSSDFEMAS